MIASPLHRLGLATLALVAIPAVAQAQSVDTLPPPECLVPNEKFIVSRDPLWLNERGKPIEPLNAAVIASLRDLSDRLKARGKELILLFPPHPSMNLPADIAVLEGVDVAAMRAGYSLAIGQLSDAGIKTIDVLEAFAPYAQIIPFNNTIDNHWTSAAGSVVAAELARALGNSVGEVSAVVDQISSWRSQIDLYRVPLLRSVIAPDCTIEDYRFSDYGRDIPLAEVTEDSAESLFGEQEGSVALIGSS